MPTKPQATDTTEIPFADACTVLDRALGGTLRQEVVAEAARARTLGGGLLRLRSGMQAHSWSGDGQHVSLERTLRRYDGRTRADGFHVLHDWDGRADQVTEETIAVSVLNYILQKRGLDAQHAPTLAIALDYYFLYVLALLSLRAWDDGAENANFDRLNALLAALQGPHGSGQRFADHAGTLLLIATSHFEIDDAGVYDRLLVKVRTLSAVHRLGIALDHAACLGSHLRFGFEASYVRDVGNMRHDNVADYPWLLFSAATLMEEYVRLEAEGVEGLARDRVVEGLANALSTDAGAFTGDRPPPALGPHADEWTRFRERFDPHRRALAEQFERFRPGAARYSPMSFFFNFSQNVLKGIVVDALAWGEPWDLSLNDLFTGVPEDDPRGPLKEKLARTLMGYAQNNPNRIRGRLMPVIVYDPVTGRRLFGAAMRQLRG